MKRILLALCLALAAGPGQSATLKIATLAPDGSTWMVALKSAAAKVETRTEGRVVTRFYPGGVMGDADMLLRRMKLGQLQGGMFTVGELAGVAPETNLYSLPFQFRNRDELRALRDEFDPLILEALYQGGLVAPAITNGGFAYLFSTRRIESTDDVSSDLKVWIPENDPLSRRTLERIGATAVPLSLAEVYTALQTGTINTFANTLSGAIILQWHTRAEYMLDLPVLITAGVLAVDRKAFERLGEADRRIWLEEFERVFREQESRTVEENRRAREALIEQGIKIVEPDPADARHWREIATDVVRKMTASGEFPVPGLDALMQRLDALRDRTEAVAAQ